MWVLMLVVSCMLMWFSVFRCLNKVWVLVMLSMFSGVLLVVMWLLMFSLRLCGDVLFGCGSCRCSVVVFGVRWVWVVVFRCMVLVVSSVVGLFLIWGSSLGVSGWVLVVEVSRVSGFRLMRWMDSVCLFGLVWFGYRVWVLSMGFVVVILEWFSILVRLVLVSGLEWVCSIRLGWLLMLCVVWVNLVSVVLLSRCMLKVRVMFSVIVMMVSMMWLGWLC